MKKQKASLYIQNFAITYVVLCFITILFIWFVEISSFFLTNVPAGSLAWSQLGRIAENDFSRKVPSDIVPYWIEIYEHVHPQLYHAEGLEISFSGIEHCKERPRFLVAHGTIKGTSHGVTNYRYFMFADRIPFTNRYAIRRVVIINESTYMNQYSPVGHSRHRFGIFWRINTFFCLKENIAYTVRVFHENNLALFILIPLTSSLAATVPVAQQPKLRRGILAKATDDCV